MIRYCIPGLLSIALLASCSSSRTSSTKSIRAKAVPAGQASAVVMTAKKGAMTDAQLKAWSHMSLLQDSVPGINLAKAYALLQGRKADTIVVGIIDSGLDFEHEDLVGQVWTNPRDATANGQDEDGNGLTDDVHGWNFLGGAQGEPVYATQGLTREYVRYEKRFKDVNPNSLPASDTAAYRYYLGVKQSFEALRNSSTQQYAQYKQVLEQLTKAHQEVSAKLGKSQYTAAEVKALPQDANTTIIVKMLEAGSEIVPTISILTAGVQQFEDMVTRKLNPDFNGRVNGDNPDDMSQTHYGNAYIKGSTEKESHSSHVTGIMLATRNNGKGINGVVNTVKFIGVRAVPNGDEYDKDIALAIRYMVDQGAKVVNMSFGKSHSAHPEWVYEAMQYAASKDVLLVRAAGNDGKNVDINRNYPNDAEDNIHEFTNNVLCVGSITRHFDQQLVSDFSNYGKINVDVFAPGSEIYSTVPGNKYDFKQGTSMASPAVAGIAALIRSYFPQLSASQVKQIIMHSGDKVMMDVLVPKSGGKATMSFADMSVSGRIVNAANAVAMAAEMVGGK